MFRERALWFAPHDIRHLQSNSAPADLIKEQPMMRRTLTPINTPFAGEVYMGTKEQAPPIPLPERAI